MSEGGGGGELGERAAILGEREDFPVVPRCVLAPWLPAGPPALIPSDSLCYKCVRTETRISMHFILFPRRKTTFFFFSRVFL